MRRDAVFTDKGWGLCPLQVHTIRKLARPHGPATCPGDQVFCWPYSFLLQTVILHQDRLVLTSKNEGLVWDLHQPNCTEPIWSPEKLLVTGFNLPPKKSRFIKLPLYPEIRKSTTESGLGFYFTSKDVVRPPILRIPHPIWPKHLKNKAWVEKADAGFTRRLGLASLMSGPALASAALIHG